MDSTTRQPAVGALPVAFVRSPDRSGSDGQGRYLIAVNSGFGIQFNAAGNRAQQSLGVIDLNAKPAPDCHSKCFLSHRHKVSTLGWCSHLSPLMMAPIPCLHRGASKTKSGCFVSWPAVRHPSLRFRLGRIQLSTRHSSTLAVLLPQHPQLATT